MRRGQGESPQGMSPYATGGGGVTFERKVAVRYLAHMLVPKQGRSCPGV